MKSTGTIHVKVMLFGATADVVGSRELDQILDDGMTVGSLIDRLSNAHPQLADHKLLVAVNEEYASANSALSAGDRVAIFTPVSGG